jgi:hypothetical protein
MKKLVFYFAAGLAIAAALNCARTIAAPKGKNDSTKDGGKKMHDVIRTIQLSGFDSAGEPEIRVMVNGDLYVVFNFMPPSDSPDPDDLGTFRNFDQEMEKAIGIPVRREDREFFLIKSPRPDTVERLRNFVSKYRSK